MTKKLTVHVKDSPRESYIEVDGERLKADWVRCTWGEKDGEVVWRHVDIAASDFEIVDERSGAEGE